MPEVEKWRSKLRRVPFPTRWRAPIRGERPGWGWPEADRVEAVKADLVVVANRLPIEVSASHRITRSPGGLASALSSVTDSGSHWVGWPGSTVELPDVVDYEGLRLHPVAISAVEYRSYYEGFANSILWPLFHGRLRPVEIDRNWWRAYREVNQRFATTVARFAPAGSSVWVHDYQLLLAPAMIRARRPDVRIGSFLHIPFPNAQLFATLPWRRELLLGMADADVIGFQTKEDVHNFTEALERTTLGSRRKLGTAKTVDAFPISVDFDHWTSLGETAAADRPTNRALVGGDFIFLGVDRLDYTKGIGQRLRAFGELLDEGRLDPARCTFVQFAVPTRESVAAYREEREEVEGLVVAINARHTQPGHEPVHYRHEGLDENQLTGWYCSADALVVTSLADGMNLVAKEFVASRTDLDGSVVLSEFTGAASDLPGALLVNPFDIEAIKDALLRAVGMMPSERHERMSTMRAAVQANDVHHWARSFLDRLEAVGVPLDTRYVRAPVRRRKRPRPNEDRRHRPAVAPGAPRVVRRNRVGRRHARPRPADRRARRPARRPSRLDLPGAVDVGRAGRGRRADGQGAHRAGARHRRLRARRGGRLRRRQRSHRRRPRGLGAVPRSGRRWPPTTTPSPARRTRSTARSPTGSRSWRSPKRMPLLLRCRSPR